MNQGTSVGIGKNRIESLADGIFAIALTLLVLDIKVPGLDPEEDSSHLFLELAALWPKFAAFVLSFLIIGVHWFGHHALMHYIRRADRSFIWLNLLYLLLISSMPFSTALLGAHHEVPLAFVVYAGNLIFAGLLLYAQFRYAAGPGRLFDADLDASFLRAGGRRILMGPFFYAIAIGLAFLNTGLSLAICALVPILYIFPGRVDAFWKQGHREQPSVKTPV